MKETSNLKLKKPDGTDYIDINDLNYNFDVLDKELNKKNDVQLPKNIAISNGQVQNNLNSDMLNGRHECDFVKTLRLSAKDFQNTKLAAGLYTNTGDGILNADNSIFKNGWWHVEVSHHFDNNGFGLQTISPLNDYNESRYYRTSNGEAWNNWIKILDQRDYDRLFQFASNGKNLIADAIAGKGIQANRNNNFETLSNIIKNSLSPNSSSSKYNIIFGTTNPTSNTTIRITNIPFTPIKCFCVISGEYSSDYIFFEVLIYETEAFFEKNAEAGIGRDRQYNTLCLYGSEKAQKKDRDGICLNSKNKSYFDAMNQTLFLEFWGPDYETLSNFTCTYAVIGQD